MCSFSVQMCAFIDSMCALCSEHWDSGLLGAYKSCAVRGRRSNAHPDSRGRAVSGRRKKPRKGGSGSSTCAPVSGAPAERRAALHARGLVRRARGCHLVRALRRTDIVPARARARDRRDRRDRRAALDSRVPSLRASGRLLHQREWYVLELELHHACIT